MDVSVPPHFSKWIIDMDTAAKEIDLNREAAAWKQPSIYCVTSFARHHNPNAFTPQVISFGPFHHGSEHLNATEEAKHRALKHFLKRARKGSEPFVRKLQSILEQLQDSYQGLDKKWKDNPYEFLKMMLLDGCFMIEVLRLNEHSDNYATNDPVFSSQKEPLRKPYIKRDMLLLENQLPLLVLKALLEVENIRPIDDEYINRLVLSYCGENLKANLSRLASHPLELYRMSLICVHEDTTSRDKLSPLNKTNFIENAMKLWECGVHFKCNEDTISEVKSPRTNMPIFIENAMKLWECGVHFKCNKDINFTSLREIKFDSNTGTLELPFLEVHDGTEYFLLNMIAYEQIHIDIGNEITSYLMFMVELINTADDVELLQRKKIIHNSLTSYKNVADLFNNMSKEVAHDFPNDVFNNERSRLSKYYKKRRNTLWAFVRYHWIHNRWRVLSIAGTLFAFLSCTLVQTVCNLLQILPSRKMP